MKKRVYDIYLEIVGSFLKVYEGTLPTLIKLKEKGYKLALASSADAVKINANLTVAGIDKSIFDVIISGGDVKNKKPAPDIYLKTAKTLGEEPEKCVVIEDAINGVKAAKDAGMICIGLTTSFSKDRILDAGADYICSDIKDIYDIIKN